MNAILLKASRRFLLSHPWQFGLAVVGIALGVAVVVGVDLANNSAQRAFELSADLVVGEATHQLVGAGGTIPESLYTEMRVKHGVHRAAPVIEARIDIPALPDKPITLLGLDPFAERGFRSYLARSVEEPLRFTPLLTGPNRVVLPTPLADALAVERGDKLTLFVNGQEKVVEIVELVTLTDDRRRVSGGFVFTDIAIAQELVGLAGHISRIDLILSPEEEQRLETHDFGGAELISAAARGNAFIELTRAFRINLTALSLLALVVGTFLIYSTVSFMVVQRRAVMGIERAIGVTPRQLFSVTMLEAGALGAIGTVGGLALGALLSTGLVQLVLRTIEDLYFATEIQAVPPDPYVFLKGAVLGLGAALLAGLAPAYEAASTTPRVTMSRSELETATHKRFRIAARLSVFCLLGAALMFSLPMARLQFALIGLFFVIAAAALATPMATIGLMHVLQGPAALAFGLPGRLAARGAAASLSRTGVAVAALSVAVATVIGIGVMIASFRMSVTDWLDRTLQSDFYLRLDPSIQPTMNSAFANDSLEELESVPGVAGLSLSRWLRVQTPQGEIRLRALQPGPRGWGREILHGDERSAWNAFQHDEGVIISEPLSHKRNLYMGDKVTLLTREGLREFDIVGVYRDYSTEQGAVDMHLSTYRRYWHDPTVSGVGVYVSGPEVASSVYQALEHIAAHAPGVQLRANEDIRTASLAIFDRTFTITEVLRLLAGAVAFLGVLGALLALELERGREVAVLRATGWTPLQIRQLVLVQTGLLGIAAGLFALPVGITLAALLVYVINERAFGWSMAFQIPIETLAGGFILAVVAALLAGIYPAFRMTRTVTATALREE